MILPALIDHYDRLAADPESGVAPLGFSRQQVSFCVKLDADGRLVEIADQRQMRTTGKGQPRLAAMPMIVPEQSKPSGRGISPRLLWDKADYMLGWKAADTNPERTQKRREAFRDRHLALREEIDDEAFAAVCRFLERWNPTAFGPTPEMQKYLGSSGVFRVGDERVFVHERPRIRTWYVVSLRGCDKKEGDLRRAPSLISGRPARIARLHEPRIKGVANAQSAGAPLVSFNEDAFESYGKSQGDNAPVAEEDAFKYCTALNHLLDDPSRRSTIGDATAVWWTDAADSEGVDLASVFFKDGVPEDVETEVTAEDEAKKRELRDTIDRISRGLAPAGLTGMEEGLFVLGLSPANGRLSVRFWWSGPLREMIDRITRHHADARLEPVSGGNAPRPFSIGRIVGETARIHHKRSDMKTVSPILVGEVARAVFTGSPYPHSLLETIVRRARADGEISHARASIVRACITRRRRLLAGPHATPEEVPVSLNPDGPEAYQLGRLFAVLEKTQADALGDVGANIRKSYFGGASVTPAALFPRLIRLSQHHLDKLDGGRRINRDKLIQGICAHLDRFPRHLTLEEQGLFQIGYFHQREDLYRKTDPAEPATTEES